MCENCDCGGNNGVPPSESDLVFNIVLIVVVVMAGWKFSEIARFCFDAMFSWMFN